MNISPQIRKKNPDQKKNPKHTSTIFLQNFSKFFQRYIILGSTQMRPRVFRVPVLLGKLPCNLPYGLLYPFVLIQWLSLSLVVLCFESVVELLRGVRGGGGRAMEVGKR
jgi:hypothetical protein